MAPMCIPFLRPTSCTTTLTPLAHNGNTRAVEGRNDVGIGEMRRIMVGHADRPCASIVLEPPDADSRITATNAARSPELVSRTVLRSRDRGHEPAATCSGISRVGRGESEDDRQAAGGPTVIVATTNRR